MVVELCGRVPGKIDSARRRFFLLQYLLDQIGTAGMSDYLRDRRRFLSFVVSGAVYW